MKRTISLSVLYLALVFAGCSKVKSLSNISIDIPDSTQISIPQVMGYTTGTVLPAGGLDLPAVSTGIATNSQAYLSQYGSASEKVVSVSLKSFILKITAPPNQNFDFLDNIQIYISTNSLPQVLVAYASTVPKGTNTLTLVTNTDINLKNYFIQDTIFLTMAAHVNTIPPAGEVLDINAVFHMIANPLN